MHWGNFPRRRPIGHRDYRLRGRVSLLTRRSGRPLPPPKTLGPGCGEWPNWATPTASGAPHCRQFSADSGHSENRDRAAGVDPQLTFISRERMVWLAGSRTFGYVRGTALCSSAARHHAREFRERDEEEGHAEREGEPGETHKFCEGAAVRPTTPGARGRSSITRGRRRRPSRMAYGMSLA